MSSMIQKKVIVNIPRGLQRVTHISLLTEKIYAFNIKVTIKKNGNIVSAGKNMMMSQFAINMLDLAIEQGEEITLTVSGIDEYPALIELEKFLLNKDGSIPSFNIE